MSAFGSKAAAPLVRCASASEPKLTFRVTNLMPRRGNAKTVAHDICEIHFEIIDVNSAKYSIRDQRLLLVFQTKHNVTIFDFAARLTDGLEFELASDLKRLNPTSWHDGGPNVPVC